MNCEANLGFLPVAVIFSTMQELNVFSSSNPVLLSLASVLFQNSRKQFGPETGYSVTAQKSFSRNVIFNKFQMEKKLKILQGSRSMLAYFARRTFNRLENEQGPKSTFWAAKTLQEF